MIVAYFRSRSEFLLPLKVALTPCKDVNEICWTLVDSEGEEDEDPQNSWHFLPENDVVLLLDQVPLDLLFRHVLGVDNQTGNFMARWNIPETTILCESKFVEGRGSLVHDAKLCWISYQSIMDGWVV